MTFNRIVLTISLGISALGAGVSSASAGVVLSPVAASATSTFYASTDISNTITQVGLLTPFVSGVTDWATYFAGGPLHGVTFSNEWFTETGVLEAVVTYDLGAVYTLATLALWNEDTNGIGSTDILASTDGFSFSPVVSGFVPVQGAINTSYGAQFVEFFDLSARYIRFDITDCPNPAATGSGEFCAIGEVAFDIVAPPVPFPEPISLALLAAGFGGLGLARRRCA